MLEGLKRSQRRKLVRFGKLARRGARMRRLLRPIIEDKTLLKLPQVFDVISKRRLQKSPPKGWTPPQRHGRASFETRTIAQLRRSPSLLDDKSFMAKLPNQTVSLLRAFITMGRRIARMGDRSG